MVTVNARGSKDKDLTICTTTFVRRLSLDPPIGLG
jgi:hypothetical protein